MYDRALQNGGELFGLPVVMDTRDSSVAVGDKILLTYQGQDLAVFTVESKWAPNKPKEAKHCYGTTSIEHPAVSMITTERGKFYLGARLLPLPAPAPAPFIPTLCCGDHVQAWCNETYTSVRYGNPSNVLHFVLFKDSQVLLCTCVHYSAAELLDISVLISTYWYAIKREYFSSSCRDRDAPCSEM